MKRLRKFVFLSGRDRKLLVKTAGVLWFVRLGLWLLSYETLCRLVRKHNPSQNNAADVVQVKRIVRSVRKMSRYVPASTCLTKALAAIVLLERADQPANLVIGVAKSQVGDLEAHAWVECQGRVILGGTHAELSRYSILRPV